MVTRLNKLLSHEGQSRKLNKPSNRKCGILDHSKIGLTQHIKILNHANVTYTLRRGAVTTTSQYDSRFYNLTSFRKLGHHLEYNVLQMLQSFTNDGCTKCLTAFFSTNIDRSIRTIMRILNYRVCSLWRPDQKSPTLRDSCLLYDDVEYITQLFDKLSSTLHHFIENKKDSQPVSLPSLKSAKLAQISGNSRISSHDESSYCWMIVTQLLKIRLTILPGIISRIEKYSHHYIIQETNGVCTACLKRDSFLGSYRTIKTAKNVPVRSELTLPDMLLELLDSKLFSPAATMMRCDNFLIVAKILSVGFNTALQAILSYVLSKKLQFNQQGVIVLYATLQKFQNWILDVKGRLLISEHCCIPEDRFHIIQDNSPWIQANIILGILQTGRVLSVESPSEEFFAPKSSAKIRGKRSVSLHFHNAIFPLRTYIKERERNDEVNVLEQLLPVRARARLKSRQEQPSNPTSMDRTTQFSFYIKSSTSPEFIRSWVILDSMRILYHNHTVNRNDTKIKTKTKTKTLCENAIHSRDLTAWGSIAAKTELTTLSYFHPLSFFKCMKKSSPKRSSVSVCVAIDVNNF
jgi:hypothetical protein